MGFYQPRIPFRYFQIDPAASRHAPAWWSSDHRGLAKRHLAPNCCGKFRLLRKTIPSVSLLLRSLARRFWIHEKTRCEVSRGNSRLRALTHLVSSGWIIGVGRSRGRSRERQLRAGCRQGRTKSTCTDSSKCLKKTHRKNALASLSIAPQPPLHAPTTCSSRLTLRCVTVTCDMARCFCSVFC